MKENKIKSLDPLEFGALSENVKEYIFFLEQYREVVDDSNIVSKTNPEGIITYANKMFIEISGYQEYELVGKNHNIIRHPDTPARVFKNLWDTIQNKKSWHGIVKNLKKDGGYYIVEATIIPVLDRAGNILEYIAIRKDITRLVDQRRMIRKQTTDALTGYPNYNKLVEDMEKSSNRIIVLLNVDMFQAIVDFYGEELANNVLKEIADRIYAMSMEIPGQFKLYKMISDEFVLHTDTEMNTEEIEKIVQAIFAIVMKDSIVFIKSMEIHFSLSIGVYMGDEAGALTKARIALKHARSAKKGFYIYDEKLTRQHYKNFNEVMILKSAIRQNKIVPFYQPIIDLKTGLITKYESLVRLQRNGQEVFLPGEFLDTAKRSKLYPYITSAVIANVIKIAGNKPYDFSINLSVEDIVDRRTNQMIIDAVSTYKNANRNLIFEITESENIDNFDEVADFIKAVKNFGCKIAIDDFGSGYSNFEYLAKLDIDYLKVDGSLIRNMRLDKSIYKIVKIIVEFSREMGYKTVAEYIENEEVLDIVKELGFDYCQGFYIGEPEAIEF